MKTIFFFILCVKIQNEKLIKETNILGAKSAPSHENWAVVADKLFFVWILLMNIITLVFSHITHVNTLCHKHFPC